MFWRVIYSMLYLRQVVDGSSFPKVLSHPVQRFLIEDKGGTRLQAMSPRIQNRPRPFVEGDKEFHAIMLHRPRIETAWHGSPSFFGEARAGR